MRFFSAIILLILILVFSSFAVINRDLVFISFDFLSLFLPLWEIGDMALERDFEPQKNLIFEVPLFLVIFCSALVGLGVGMLLPIMNFFQKKGKQAAQRRLERQVSAQEPAQAQDQDYNHNPNG